MKKIIGTAVVFVLFTFISQLTAGEVPKDVKTKSLKSLITGLENGNTGLKVSCALTIGEYRMDEATDVLSGILTSDDDADVKFAAMVALYKIKTKASVNALKSAAAHLEDAYLSHIAEVLYTDIMRDKNAKEEYGK